MVMDLGSISQDGVWNIELVVSTNRYANGIEKKKISRSDWFKSETQAYAREASHDAIIVGL